MKNIDKTLDIILKISEIVLNFSKALKEILVATSYFKCFIICNLLIEHIGTLQKRTTQ